MVGSWYIDQQAVNKVAFCCCLATKAATQKKPTGSWYIIFQLLQKGQIENGQKTCYTMSSGSLQTGGLSVVVWFHWRNGIRARSIVVVTARRAGIYYENYSHTHNRVPHPVCVEPSSMMNNRLSAMKTRQLCTQWWELDRVEWARSVPEEEEEEGGQTKAVSFHLLLVVGSDVWSSQ